MRLKLFIKFLVAWKGFWKRSHARLSMKLIIIDLRKISKKKKLEQRKLERKIDTIT